MTSTSLDSEPVDTYVIESSVRSMRRLFANVPAGTAVDSSARSTAVDFTTVALSEVTVVN